MYSRLPSLPPHSQLLSLCIIASTVYLAPAHADNPSLETMVITASRIEQEIGDFASSISVLSQRDLEMIDATHVNQALVRVPGVWISRGNGQEHLTAIRSPVLTGAGSCGSFEISKNGVPVRGTGFCNANQLFDVNTEQAQRIEVLRGPGTSLHGNFSISRGNIN